MTRATRKHLEGCFVAFCKRQGWKVATSYNDVGAYSLDYAPIYGGYRIIQITNDRGCQTNITDRFTPKELLAFFSISYQVARWEELNK